MFLLFIPCDRVHIVHMWNVCSIRLNYCRYAIGNAERPMLKSKIGWLDILANDTHEYYTSNNTGGPSIKVSIQQKHTGKHFKHYIHASRWRPINQVWMCDEYGK